MPTKLNQFAEKVLHCAKIECPFWQDRYGAYPKFSYGNTRSNVMIVFQNPGQPVGKESSKTIQDVTIREMRNWAGEGVVNWLIGSRNLPTTLFNLKNEDFLRSYYITQSYRCPDPLDKAFADKTREKARQECLDYFREEARLARPTVVLAVGKDALRSVRDVLSPSTRIREIYGIKNLFLSKKVFEWNGVRVYPIPHPDGIWRNPAIPQDEYINTVRWYIRQIEKL